MKDYEVQMYMKMLSISPVCPFDNIGHAGGKTYNFYLKNLSKYYDISALIFCPLADSSKIDLNKCGINYDLIFTSGTLKINIFHLLFDIIGYLIYKNKMFSFFKYYKIIKYLDDLKKEGRFPDIVELEWTNFVYYAKLLRKRYPNLKIIGSEHDVNFQKLTRKKINNKYFFKLKKQELESLNCCDLILVQSDKDKILLVQEKIPESKILIICPFYHDMSNIKRRSNGRDILFWGAMYRPENYEAAIWFIKNVMTLLNDKDVRFIVAGNRPPEELKKLANEKIIITGYVDDEISLFEKSMCFVSPLLSGAGIKVKVIEALSAGIPVLTNLIGIEGINAVNNREYIYCESAEQYADSIIKLQEGMIREQDLTKNQVEFIKTKFNLNSSLDSYISMIKTL